MTGLIQSAIARGLVKLPVKRRRRNLGNPRGHPHKFKGMKVRHRPPLPELNGLRGKARHAAYMQIWRAEAKA